MEEKRIVNIDKTNMTEHRCTCFMKPDSPGHLKKVDWMGPSFKEDGLKLKLMMDDTGKKVIGYIEYIDGRNAWRAVNAEGYMFIHCLWTNPKKIRNLGNGSLLIEEAMDDAIKNGMKGVAVVTSEGPFMAGKNIFLKNGFEVVAEEEPSYSLLVKRIEDGPGPRFMDWKRALKEYEGLNIVYSNQCSWVARSIEEITEYTATKKIDIKVIELKNPEEAQKGPSVYGTFSLINDGELLVDHYISTTRFKNIVKKLKE